MAYIEEHFVKIDDRKTHYFRGTWLNLARPLTLSGSITPILVGTGLAYYTGAFSWLTFILFFFTALIIQIVVNMLNDYFDYAHGQDKEKWTEDKHGARQRISMYHILIVSICLLAIAAISGFFLAYMTHLIILPIGIISVILGVKYSAGKHAFAAIAMGELIAFLCLGVVVTNLAYFVQTTQFSLGILLISLLFGSLIAIMVMTNNICDMKKDLKFRLTLPLLLGEKRATEFLLALVIILYTLLTLLIIGKQLPLTTLLCFIALPFAVGLVKQLFSKVQTKDKKQLMAYAAYHHLTFGLTLAIVVWLFT